MRGLVNIIFLIHLVITQGDNSDQTQKFDQMLIRIESSRNITMQTRQLRPQIRLQIDQMSRKLKKYYKRVSYRPQSLTSNSNKCLCVRLQIDQMSIKIESSRNITNVSAIDHKVQLQMETSVCVSDFKLIKCRLKLKAQKILQTCQL